MTRPPQEIRIDRLVLPPGTVGAPRVRAAVERELARLLTTAPVAQGQATQLASIDAGKATGSDPEAMGIAIARRLHADWHKAGR